MHAHVLGTAAAVLAAAGPSTGHGSRSPVAFAIAAIIFAGAGLLNVLKPDVGWRLSKWQYRNQEALRPSRSGLVAARVSGGIAVVVAIVLIFVALTR